MLGQSCNTVYFPGSWPIGGEELPDAERSLFIHHRRTALVPQVPEPRSGGKPMRSREHFIEDLPWTPSEKKVARKALLRDGWLNEVDLAGLQQEKIDRIERWADL